MSNFLLRLWLITRAFIVFAFSPVHVFYFQLDKRLHFFIPCIVHLLLMHFQPVVLNFKITGGISGIALIVLAIIKEEVIDGMLRYGQKDLLDVYWSFKGVMWATFFYLLITTIWRLL